MQILQIALRRVWLYGWWVSVETVQPRHAYGWACIYLAAKLLLITAERSSEDEMNGGPEAGATLAADHLPFGFKKK